MTHEALPLRALKRERKARRRGGAVKSRLGFWDDLGFGMIKSIRNRLNFGQDPIM